MSRLAALLPIAFVACVETGDEGMFVVENTAVTGTSCTLSGMPGQGFISHGIINFQSVQPYLLTPLIQSRIAAVSDVDTVSKTIQLRGADIKLTLVATTVEVGGAFTTTQQDAALPSFSTLFSGALPPAGFINVGFDLIPAGTLRSIANMSGVNLETDTFQSEVLAEVSVRGELNSNTITSSPFVFPVTVCNNCVLNVIGACPMVGSPRTGNPCNPAQDGIVDCCTDAAGGLVCPATTTMM